MYDPLPKLSTGRRPLSFRLSSAPGTAVLVCLMQLLCSCSFYSPTVSVAVHLPPLPPHWREAFPELAFRIVYPSSENGGFEEQQVDNGAGVDLELPKILYLPVLAYPNLPEQSLPLAPAGGVYPLDCDITNAISLSWHEGATAEVLYRLWRQGVDCSAIDVPRLSREMSLLCQADPWALDLNRICARLAAETFRVTDIRLAPSRDLLLQPGQGSWFLESPFRIQVPADADGSLFLQDVSLGAHSLFGNPPTTCFFLYVQEETALMIRR
jgi:hypothetical protein